MHISNQHNKKLYIDRSQGVVNPISGVPRGCSQLEGTYKGRNIIFLGTSHTGDSSKEVFLNKKIHDWLKESISVAGGKHTAVLVELYEALLADRSNWDDREMFVAVNAAEKSGATVVPFEPKSERSLMMKEETLSQWLVDDTGKALTPDEGSNPPTYKGESLAKIWKTFVNIRISHRKTLEPEYIEIAEKFQPGFKSLLTEDYNGRIGLFAIVPGKCLTEAGEAWMKAKHKPGFFNRMADASVYVRDQNVLSKIEELPVSNKKVIIVCGSYHVKSIRELMKSNGFPFKE